MRSSPVTQAGVKTQTIVRLIILLLTGGSLYCLDMNLREEQIEGKQHNQHQYESVKNITKQHKHIIWQSKFTKWRIINSRTVLKKGAEVLFDNYVGDHVEWHEPGWLSPWQKTHVFAPSTQRGFHPLYNWCGQMYLLRASYVAGSTFEIHNIRKRQQVRDLLQWKEAAQKSSHC